MTFQISFESRGNGTIQYCPSELSFDTIEPEERLFTITFGDLYLGLDIGIDCRTVCAVSGLSPSGLWRASKIEFPDARDGRLTVNVPDAVRGCGYSYAGDWHVCYDRDARMILVSRPSDAIDCGGDWQSVRFLRNAIAVLWKSELIALYIEDIAVAS